MIININSQIIFVISFVKGFQNRCLMKIAISNNTINFFLKNAFHIMNTFKRDTNIQNSFKIEDQTKHIQRSIQNLKINDIQSKIFFNLIDLKDPDSTRNKV